MLEQPIFNDTCVLKKFSGKGGWTFVMMPALGNLPKKKNGTVRVRGFIDDFELINYNMWAMKQGNFVAVKAEIRKKIGKEEGDTVKVLLYLDEPEMVVCEDFFICLREDPALLARFEQMSEKARQDMIDWIFSAKTDDDKVVRIAKSLEKLELGLT